MNHQTATRRLSPTPQLPIGNRRTVNIPARLTWCDASGTLRFASVVLREVSDVDVFVECQVPATIPLYRLVNLQVERPSHDQGLPEALRTGKVLSAVYSVGARAPSTGTPIGYALRLLVEPKPNAPSFAHVVEQRLAVAN